MFEPLLASAAGGAVLVGAPPKEGKAGALLGGSDPKAGGLFVFAEPNANGESVEGLLAALALPPKLKTPLDEPVEAGAVDPNEKLLLGVCDWVSGLPNWKGDEVLLELALLDPPNWKTLEPPVEAGAAAAGAGGFAVVAVLPNENPLDFSVLPNENVLEVALGAIVVAAGFDAAPKEKLDVVTSFLASLLAPNAKVLVGLGSSFLESVAPKENEEDEGAADPNVKVDDGVD